MENVLISQSKHSTELSNNQELSPQVDRASARLSLAYVGVAFIAFGLAAIAGLLQGLERGGMITFPSWLNYYEVLTAHGVLMGLVFTTFFIVGFFFAGIARTSQGSLTSAAKRWGWLGFVTMVVGTSMGVVTILQQDASVLYTFYAPMKASPWFYIGSALLIIGSWFAGFGMFAHYRSWRKEHRGEHSPILMFMAIATMVLWQIATIGVAAEVVLQLIPWSFGWVPTVDILLSRTLFWFFGHPLVYFWLLPAYAAWYGIIPQIIGGKIFSDSLIRLSFILFILFSIPVGFHHQLMEPGISSNWKFLHVVLTLAVVIPSLITAFSLFAVFETTGRAKGGTGLFGWFGKMPWGDVRFFAPVIAMFWFVPAGLGGIINASNELNAVVHNTIWVTGHFHLTVGTSVALTFFGISYWLIPSLTGRKLTSLANDLGIFQTIFWSLGMLLMSGSMHTMGLLGVPRRTSYTTYMDDPTALSWIPYEKLMAIGGVLLFIGALLMVWIVIYLTFLAPKGYTEFPVAVLGNPADTTPRILENWPLWLSISTLLILLAYGLPIYEQITDMNPGAPGIRTW